MRLILLLMFMVGCSSSPQVRFRDVKKDQIEFFTVLGDIKKTDRSYNRAITKCHNDVGSVYTWIFPSEEFRDYYCEMVVLELAGVTREFDILPANEYSDMMELKRRHNLSDSNFMEQLLAKAEQTYYYARSAVIFAYHPENAIQLFDRRDPVYIYTLSVAEVAYNVARVNPKFYYLFQIDGMNINNMRKLDKLKSQESDIKDWVK